MTSILTFITILFVFVIPGIYQRKEDKKRKQEYLDRALEYSLKGDRESADMYYMVASRIK